MRRLKTLASKEMLETREKTTAASGVTANIISGILQMAVDCCCRLSRKKWNVTIECPAASVNWGNIPLWQTEGEAGPDQLTPNFAAVVQEIVDQGGWAANNAMVIIMTPNPGGERTAESYDGDAGAAALLNIDFTPVPEPSTIVLAGLGLVGVLGLGWRGRR